MGLTVSKMSEKPVYIWTHKFTQKRDIEWYYSLVLAYRVEFDHLNIIPSEECSEAQFFTKEEIVNLNLAGQMRELPDILNFADFKDPF